MPNQSGRSLFLLKFSLQAQHFITQKCGIHKVEFLGCTLHLGAQRLYLPLHLLRCEQ